MRPRRTWFWLALTLGISVAVSVGLTVLTGRPIFLGFLFLPFFLPFALRRGEKSASLACPSCGWTTDDPSAVFCVRDGTRLT